MLASLVELVVRRAMGSALCSSADGAGHGGARFVRGGVTFVGWRTLLLLL